MTKTILATFFSCAALAVPSMSLSAEGTLSASPAVVMLAGAPGQSTTQTLMISNATSHTMSFEMKAKDVIVRDGERTFADPGSTGGGIAETATFTQKLVTVAPGETARVDVTVTIPANPSSRAVVALFTGTQPVKANGMSITPSLGTLMTFALSDNVGADASALHVQPPTMTSNLVVGQRLVSNGTEPLVAKGMLAIVNASGALVGKEAIPARRLLPGERADIRAEYGGELSPGRYRALVTYDLKSKTVTSTAEFDVR